MDNKGSSWDKKYTWVHFLFSFFYCGMVWWMMYTWHNPWLVILMLLCPTTLTINLQKYMDLMEKDNKPVDQNDSKYKYGMSLIVLHEMGMNQKDVMSIIDCNKNGVWLWDKIDEKYVKLCKYYKEDDYDYLVMIDTDDQEYVYSKDRYMFYQPITSISAKEEK